MTSVFPRTPAIEKKDSRMTMKYNIHPIECWRSSLHSVVIFEAATIKLQVTDVQMIPVKALGIDVATIAKLILPQMKFQTTNGTM